MKVKCPACGAAMSLDALIGHDEARAALVAVSGISDELVRGCLKYLGLFRPLEKDLTFARVAKLVGELRPMMAAGQISRNRQDYPAPREAWLWAFEQVLVARDNGKLQRLPLTTHGFLLETLTFWAPAKSQAAAPVPFVPTDGGLQVNTKLRQGVAALAAWAGGDWLRQELAAGFAELAAMNLQGRPAAAPIRWHSIRLRGANGSRTTRPCGRSSPTRSRLPTRSTARRWRSTQKTDELAGAGKPADGAPVSECSAGDRCSDTGVESDGRLRRSVARGRG